MRKYINPFTDYGFKRLFGENSTKESLIAFLNAVLGSEGVRISTLEYLPSVQPGERAADRTTFFDLYCTDENESHFIVEIQQQLHRNFKERLVYYAAHPIRNQGRKGKWSFDLQPVYVVAVLNFLLEPDDDPEPVSVIKLMNVHRNRVFYEKLTFVYVEMPKFKKSAAHIETPLDTWLFLLKAIDASKEIPATLKDPAIMKFLNDAELANLSEEEQYKYDRSLRAYRDRLLIRRSNRFYRLEAIKQAKAEGAAQGRAVGLAEGKAEGIAVGKAEGISESKRTTACNLIILGVAFDIISQATGLTHDELDELKRSLNNS